MNRAKSAVRGALSGALGWIGLSPTFLPLPAHVLRVSVGRHGGDVESVEVMGAVTTDWKDQAAALYPSLVSESLAVDEWEIDFGDGSRLTRQVSAGMPENISLSHVYEPGFYLMTVTVKGSGHVRVMIDISHAGVLGEGWSPIAFNCRVAATVLVRGAGTDR
jgi:hypothetical protein